MFLSSGNRGQLTENRGQWKGGSNCGTSI